MTESEQIVILDLLKHTAVIILETATAVESLQNSVKDLNNRITALEETVVSITRY